MPVKHKRKRNRLPNFDYSKSKMFLPLVGEAYLPAGRLEGVFSKIKRFIIL